MSRTGDDLPQVAGTCPGCVPDTAGGPAKSPPAIPNAKSCRRHRGRGLHVRIWENANGSWAESHIFSHWLEADCAPSSTADSPSVHLPSVSVQGMMQLRSCLERPHAVCLDPPSEDCMGAGQLWNWLSSPLEGPAAVEARHALERRRIPSKLPVSPTRQSVPSGLEMMQQATGEECMDISICPLDSIGVAASPHVVLLRCERPLNTLRYAAVVACPLKGGQEAMERARQVSRALATAFVDEKFVQQVKMVPKDQPHGVVEAFDHFLATLTIVPTVHLDTEEDAASPGRCGSKNRGVVDPVNDRLLSDSLQQQMETLLCSSLGVAQPPRAHRPRSAAHKTTGAWSHWKRCFVEVDRLDSKTKGWKMTHQLRQGMEIDAGTGKKPHLPHASVSGLAKIRDLLSAQNVALDVAAAGGLAAVEVIVQQLGAAGLPPMAIEGVASALRDRASMGVSRPTAKDASEPLSPLRVNSPLHVEPPSLVAPCEDDDAFLILLVPSQEVPSTTGITSACLRFKMPIVLTRGETPVRFLLVLVGPTGAEEEISQTGDSFAALAVDEDLLGSLDLADDEASFAAAMSRRLDDLSLMPRSHLEAASNLGHRTASDSPLSPNHSAKSSQSGITAGSGSPQKQKQKQGSSDSKVSQAASSGHHGHADPASMSPCMRRWTWCVQRIQKYSLPLVFGVTLALIWENIHPDTYHTVVHEAFSEDFEVLGHKISLHFIVNDIFMCFFFGLAIKEVTEALLPGGSLSPLKRAANPLMATCGGIIGPIAMYFVMVLVLDSMGGFDGIQCQVPESDGRRLAGGGGGGDSKWTGETVQCELSAILKGWGVPTATDISLAWMFALLIFGAGHPAINFLLLLAIVDDAIGMIIIAVAYPNPEKQPEPVWLLLVVAGSMVALALRLLKVRLWPVYIVCAAPFTWVGLLKAHVHPALALVFVVPFMPAMHAVRMEQHGPRRRLGAGVDFRSGTRLLNEMVDSHSTLRARFRQRGRSNTVMTHMIAFLQNQENAPLHLFEHHLKLPVDFGMFFFGLANAGVKVGSLGNVTVSVLVALIVGKTLGIVGFAMLAKCMGFGLPAGVNMGDLWSMGALAGIGLTVALFVSNEAFTDPELQGQAKMGALLSIVSALVSWGIRSLYRALFERTLLTTPETEVEDDKDYVQSLEDGADSNDDEDEHDLLITDELMQLLWAQRRMAARGHVMDMQDMIRTVSKSVRQASNRTPVLDDDAPERARSASDLNRLTPSSAGSRGRGLKSHATWAQGVDLTSTPQRSPSNRKSPISTCSILELA